MNAQRWRNKAQVNDFACLSRTFGFPNVRGVHRPSFCIFSQRVVLATLKHFSRAALTTYRVSPNAYVRILQEELQMSGYYAGRINGRLTASTIAAHHRFCADMGILDQCREGPLKWATIRAVTEALSTLSPVGLK